MRKLNIAIALLAFSFIFALADTQEAPECPEYIDITLPEGKIVKMRNISPCPMEERLSEKLRIVSGVLLGLLLVYKILTRIGVYI